MEVCLIRSPARPGSLPLCSVYVLEGLVFTARDRGLSRLAAGDDPCGGCLRGLAMYHCGPVAVRHGAGWRVLSAGPTTSARMAAETLGAARRLSVPVVIGKGGLGGLEEALESLGSLYLVYPGGAGSLAASSVVSVEAVYWLDELGPAEAVWVLRVEGFGPLFRVSGAGAAGTGRGSRVQPCSRGG